MDAIFKLYLHYWQLTQEYIILVTSKPKAEILTLKLSEKKLDIIFFFEHIILVLGRSDQQVGKKVRPAPKTLSILNCHLGGGGKGGCSTTFESSAEKKQMQKCLARGC